MKKKKILFEHDNLLEGGFGIEGIWATPLGDNLFKIDNIPFYVKEYALGDIVETEDREGALYAINQ